MKRRSLTTRKRAGPKPVSRYQAKQFARVGDSALATALIAARCVNPGWKPTDE